MYCAKTKKGISVLFAGIFPFYPIYDSWTGYLIINIGVVAWNSIRLAMLGLNNRANTFRL